MAKSLPELVVSLEPEAESVLGAVTDGRFASTTAYRLRLEAEQLRLVTGFDELICLDSLNFKPFPYQIRVARTALRRFRGRGLLCDEVGLGKTLEAGLVLKEYLLRQMVERVLILTPPGLVEQWREELEQKLRLTDFVTNSDPRFRAAGTEAWALFPRVIASLAVARRAANREALAAIAYDLVVIDEAHHLRSRTSVSWKFVNALQKEHMLMLTATPVENRLEELYNLITILKPGQLKTPQEFRRQFIVRGDPRLPKNRSLLRELLADVMIRHSRGQVSVKLPPRRAHTVRLPLTPGEAALYDDVSRFVRRCSQGGPDGAQRKLVLTTMQRQVGSSPMAAARTLRKLAQTESWQGERKELVDLAERAEATGTWAKADALERIVRGAGSQKIIVFTHFQATLEALSRRLEAQGVDLVTYHGGLGREQKDDAIRRFEHEVRVMLSTEAAGEGRNLQFCHNMVNFDLPWNPQRIEQRVGRIHRIGQAQRVEIFNLSAEGTIEDYLLDILDRKLNMFELVIGEMEMILGHMTTARDFEEMLLEVWLTSEDQASLASAMARFGDELVAARDAVRKIQAYDDALFGEDFTAG